MEPKAPLKLMLKNGMMITLSHEEISHPDFQAGWEKGTQRHGVKHASHAIKSPGIYRLGNDAFYACDLGVPLASSRVPAEIHAYFIPKADHKKRLRLKIQATKQKIELMEKERARLSTKIRQARRYLAQNEE